MVKLSVQHWPNYIHTYIYFGVGTAPWFHAKRTNNGWSGNILCAPAKKPRIAMGGKSGGNKVTWKNTDKEMDWRSFSLTA